MTGGWTEEVTIVVTAALVMSAVAIVLKRILTKHLDAIERVPGKEEFDKLKSIPDHRWFEKIEAILDAFPTPLRLEKHIALNHKHTSDLQLHEFMLGKHDRILEDHEKRIRASEDK
jgi:hypothetical protein